MMAPRIVVLRGGTSAEREVSLGSGRACALALASVWPTRMIDVQSNGVPSGIDPGREIVFSTLHGTFGEDGGMQDALDAAGICYAGCDAASSRLTMDKTRTKERVAEVGVLGAPALRFTAGAAPRASAIVARLGEAVVLKPNAEGSSVGLQVLAGEAAIAAALAALAPGDWLCERRIAGRELTVGIIGARAGGVVEIRPRSGVFDYASKYTKGLTEYIAPAPLEPDVAAQVQAAGLRAFAACGCRDYARVDFILSEDNELYLLELNTLPGMKETSLLPMSARCAGLDFTALVRELVTPAWHRFQAVPSTLIS